MTQPGKVPYIAKTHTMGGRDGGAFRSDDGRLDVRLSVPGKIAARRMEITYPADTADDVEVDLRIADGECFLQARHYVSLAGLDREVAADQMCPYSKATRGNIDVTINLV